MGLNEWLEVGKFLLFAFFLASASWFIWIAILESKPSRRHLFRHLGALVVSSAIVGLYLQSEFGTNGLLWVVGVYWLITAVPTIPSISLNKDGVVNSSSICLAKVVLFVSVVLFTTLSAWIYGVLLAPWGLILAGQGLATKNGPAGPQVRPITSADSR